MQADAVEVLIVDDNADLASSLADLLNLNGYTVRTAPDAATALASATNRQPHCVLLDVMMPGMNGLELARIFRSNYGDDIVLVALSGYRDVPEVKQTFDIVDHYLLKPVDMFELEKILPPMNPSS